MYNPGPDYGVNQSQIASYLRCKHQWELAYVQKLVPRVTRPAMHLGTMVHAGLAGAFIAEAYMADPYPAIVDGVAQTLEDYLKNHELFDEEQEAARLLSHKALGLAERAYREFSLDYQVHRLGDGTPAVELRVELPIRKTHNFNHFHGTVDLIAKEIKTGSIWLVDHKVRAVFQPIEDEELNIQMAAYQYLLLKKHEIKTVGTITHQIYAELPKVPARNLNGSFSVAKIRTDWATYRQAVVDAGLNPDNYLEMVDKLSGQDFWRLSRAYRTELEISSIWNEIIINTVNDMSRKVKRLPRSLSAWNCKGCQFRSICLEALRGGDVEYIKQADYMVRPVVPADEPNEEV